MIRSELMRVLTTTDVERIASDVLSQAIAKVERFTTGAGNWVYDVTTVGGERAVVRFMRDHAERESGVYWSNLLRPMGVPLPRLLAHGREPLGSSWMVLERLPGVDLEHAYVDLTSSQKLQVLDRVLAAQKVVHELPAGPAFGYTDLPNQAPHPTWSKAIASSIERSRERILQIGAVDPQHVLRVEQRFTEFEGYFATVRPIAFLDDTTTRNVIIHDGKLSGIVDVDAICYGDPLLVPSLTRMALLSMGCDTTYTDAWLDRVGASAEQRRVVDFYTAICAINFLGEQGQRFNREAAPPVDPAEVARLTSILDMLLEKL